MTQPLGPGLEPRVLRGISASLGVAIGPAVVFDRKQLPIPRRSMLPEERPAEISRLKRAIDASRERVRETMATLDPQADREHLVLLDAYAMLHHDELLIGAAEGLIGQGQNAEWAVRRVADDLTARLRSSKDSYLAERAHDVQQVAEAILRELTGLTNSLPEMSEPSILVALDLSPAEMFQLPRAKLLGLVTELGAATSHTAILARALHIPALVGVRGVTQLVPGGSRVTVDAFRAEITIGPDDDEEREAERRSLRYRSFLHSIRAREVPSTKLLSGEHIEVHANIELELEIEEALAERVDGIGLYRTEFLYLDGRSPSEDELIAVFERVRMRLSPRPVTLRTFDLGADKLPNDTQRQEPRVPNPALGLRGLRLALERRALFSTQLRAMLRVAHGSRLRVMFPMVCTLEDFDAAKHLLAEVKTQLEREGLPHGEVDLGVMVEVLSTVELLSELTEEVSFFSIGTNDLAQYTLAVDRQSPELAHMASSFSPALLRSLARIATHTAKANKDTTVCGDLATQALALPLLIGAGFRRLSVPPSDAVVVREVASRLDRARCEDLFSRALKERHAAGVRRLVMAELGDQLADLCEELGVDF